MTKPVAVVTGASRGLGLGCAQALAERGFDVVMVARNAAALQQAAGVLSVAGFSAQTVVCDVASDDDVAKVFDAVKSRFDRCDVLINNAGVFLEPHDFSRPSTIATLDTPLAMIRDSIDINSFGAWRLIRVFLPLMQQRGFGRIVNVSSGMGAFDEMGSGYPAYRFSKTILNAMTHLIAADLKQSNIKINAVCPGWVKTEMGGEHANRELDAGVASIVWAALLDEHGPSGGFFRDGKRLKW